MDTEEFFPDDEFVRKIVQTTPAVRSHLEKSRFRKPVYIIVGIKRVTGASVTSVVRTEYVGQLDVGMDATLTGTPASFGPRASLRIGHQDGMSFEDSSDIVFAFRLRKVRVNKKGEVKQYEYNRGSLLGYQVDVPPPASETFSVLDLEDRDASAEDFGLEHEEVVVMDDKEKVRVSLSDSAKIEGKRD